MSIQLDMAVLKHARQLISDGKEVRESFGCTLEELQGMVPMPLTAAG